MQTETEQLQRSKAPVSKGGQREARKQEIRAVFKFVIRTAEKSEEKLDAVDMWIRSLVLIWSSKTLTVK